MDKAQFEVNKPSCLHMSYILHCSVLKKNEQRSYMGYCNHTWPKAGTTNKKYSNSIVILNAPNLLVMLF